MHLVKINDNSFKKKEDFSEIPSLTNKTVDKTLEQLQKEGIFIFPEKLEDADDITKDEMILQAKNDQYLASNIMGFIGCGNERLVISSRFGGENDYFFQYLLDKVFEFPNIVNLNTDASSDERLFNYFMFLFPRYLSSAMRKGLYKKYIRHHYNDKNVKGTIDIAEHIKKNVPFVGNIAYSQREFSYDNHLMELVRHTIEFIKRKPNGNYLLTKVKNEVELVVQATPSYSFSDRQKVIEENSKNMINHAYYKEYLDLQRLCILILRYQKHQISNGTNKIYGILFDGAWLWEEYINQLIGDKFYHPMNKGGIGGQKLFENKNKNKIGLIYPDFISKDPNNRIIADAKYKPIDNIGNKDYLQVLAYMFRFDSKEGYYLYPDALDNEDSALHLNSGSTYENNVQAREDICITKHGLKIPTAVSSYEEFVKQIKENEQKFIRIFECLSSRIDY